jgi:O-antigen/teichoic acid export membrane protein
MEVLRAAWTMGVYVFLSMLLSLIEHGAILRHLPERLRIEKIASRALISNRIVLVLTLVGSFVAAIIIVVALTPREWPDESWPVHAAAAVYFAMAAFDDWRVRGRRFAGNPRALLGCDVLRIRQLDPY